MTSSTLRVAILADTHGRLHPRIAKVVESCDVAVHAGDIGSAAVLAAMKPKRGETHAIRGNNDTPAKWPDGEADILAELPREAALELPGGTLVVVHGNRAGPLKSRHARLRRCFPDAKAVVYGHSHRRVVDKEEKPWVLNPGAAGFTRTYGGSSCLVLSVGGNGWRIREHVFDRH